MSDFKDIVQDIGQEIDLQIKKTKNGYLVSQRNNQFSFHNDHKDKGVDKAAVQQMKDIVELNINNLKSSHIEY